MQSALRLFGSRPARLRFVRACLRWLRARLREESPVVDRVEPDVADRSGFRVRPRF